MYKILLKLVRKSYFIYLMINLRFNVHGMFTQNYVCVTKLP